MPWNVSAGPSSRRPSGISISPVPQALEGPVRHHSGIRLAAERLEHIEALPRLTQDVRDRRMPDDAFAVGNGERSRVRQAGDRAHQHGIPVAGVSGRTAQPRAGRTRSAPARHRARPPPPACGRSECRPGWPRVVLPRCGPCDSHARPGRPARREAPARTRPLRRRSAAAASRRIPEQASWRRKGPVRS